MRIGRRSDLRWFLALDNQGFRCGTLSAASRAAHDPEAALERVSGLLEDADKLFPKVLVQECWKTQKVLIFLQNWPNPQKFYTPFGTPFRPDGKRKGKNPTKARYWPHQILSKLVCHDTVVSRYNHKGDSLQEKRLNPGQLSASGCWVVVLFSHIRLLCEIFMHQIKDGEATNTDHRV